MEWVEVTAKTIEEAKEAALDQLGVAETDAEVVVLAEPKTGLFGRVRSEARVRARVRPVGPRPKRTRRPREREKSRATATATRPSEDTDSGGQGGTPRRRRSRGGGGRSGEGATPGAAGADRHDGGNGKSPRQSAKSTVKAEETDMAEGMTLEEQAEAANAFLQGLLAEFGFEAAVETRMLDEETVELAANGDDLGLLVGPRGSTLAALQDVTRTVVQRQFPSKTDRILVDVAGYRERRAAALQRFSQQVAAEVTETGTERALEAMTPADRKVVHDSVNSIDGVVTRSEGEDPARYIVIAPAG